MKEVIKIANGVPGFPLDIVTQTIAIIAKRRVGKSYAMRKTVEQELHAGQQVVIIDPKGDQWGIRSSADGKKPGFPVLILGGEHGDLPLEKNAGEVVAKLVVEEQVNILLDVSHFSKGDLAYFMAIFLETLYRLKAQEKYRTPMTLVVDEADAIAPQRPQTNEARMLGAIDDIVRRGGQRGIGTVLVTQRPAVLNKNVLTQSQMLIVLRLIAPQDIAAMKAWIDVHGTEAERKELIESVPSLPVGDAYFWSPGWPTDEGIFARGHVLPIETFDSAATPKPGETRVIPKNLADVNLDVLQKQMAATIEKAKADNPAALRKKIAELEKQIAAKLEPKVVHTGPTKVERIEVPAIGKRSIERIVKFETVMRKMLKDARMTFAATETNVQRFEEDLDKLLAEIQKVSQKAEPLKVGFYAHPQVKRSHILPPHVEDYDRTIAPRRASEIETVRITGPEQRVLNALAWCESIGNMRPPNELVAFLSGYSHFRSTGYTNPRGYLKTKGLIDYSSGSVYLTDAGRALAHPPDAPLTQEALHEAVLQKLDGPERRLLKPLLEKYPEGLSNTELCNLAGYMHERSTGYTNPRGRLKSFGLIEYEGGTVKARTLLFP